MPGKPLTHSPALCALHDLPDPGSRGFCVDTPSGPLDLFLVRQGARVHAYLNRCPHTGAPLDWVPDRFLSLDGEHIQCATHDARFRIADGLCVAGPCSGDRLQPLALRVEAGQVYLEADAADD